MARAEPAGPEVARGAQPLLQEAARQAQVLPRDAEHASRQCRSAISRTGYTGDLGYEIWMERRARAARLGRADGSRRRLRHRAVRHPRDGHGARRSGPVHDRCRLHRDRTTPGSKARNPRRSRWAWIGRCNLDKTGYFVGRRALEREKREGSAWKLVGLEIDWDGMEPLFADVGLPPQIPGDGGARQPAGDARAASRSATPRPAPGRRC